MKTKRQPARDDKGRYDHDDAALCTCGHALGVHLAARPRPCDAASHGAGPCSCERFKRARGGA